MVGRRLLLVRERGRGEREGGRERRGAGNEWLDLQG
jgi:hypothetical protein